MVEVRDLFHQLCTVIGSTRLDTTVEEVMRNLKIKVKTNNAAKYEEADDQDSPMSSGISMSTQNSELYVDWQNITVKNSPPPQYVIPPQLLLWGIFFKHF